MTDRGEEPPARCSVIVLASLTNDGSRQRRAYASQRSSTCSAAAGGEPVDLAQLLLEQVVRTSVTATEQSRGRRQRRHRNATQRATGAPRPLEAWSTRRRPTALTTLFALGRWSRCA